MLFCNLLCIFCYILRVSNALQQLFIEKPQNQTALRPPQQYCTCKKEAGPTDDPSILKFEFVQCDLSQPIDVYSCQHPNQVNEYIIDECTLSRNRRSVVNRNIPTLDDIKEVIPLTYDSSFNPNYIPQVNIHIWYLNFDMKVHACIIIFCGGKLIFLWHGWMLIM